MSFVFPAAVFDDPRKLLSLIGSFWSHTHADVQLFEDRCQVLLDQARQWHSDLLEAVDCISRFDIPVYHWERFAVFLLLETELSATYVTTLPTNLVDVSVITDRITDPTVTLYKDVDFFIDTIARTITFRTNPFDEAFSVEKMFSGGAVTDRRLVLWLNQPQYDWTFLYDHFGYVLGVRHTSSENYKNLINAIMDSLVGGTSNATVHDALSAIYDVPLVRNETETVETVADDGKNILVITDANVYKHSRTANVYVLAGDVLARGDAMCDAITLYDQRRNPSALGISGITLSAGLLSPAIGGDVTFTNTIEAVTISGPINDRRVEWPLGGDIGVVAAFWDAVHAGRLTYGYSLYELLTASGTIFEGALLNVINPMEFLLGEIFRNNLLLIVIKTSSVGDNGLDVDVDAIMRLITPPHSHVLVVED
jgi:hypothetical protein